MRIELFLTGVIFKYNERRFIPMGVLTADTITTSLPLMIENFLKITSKPVENQAKTAATSRDNGNKLAAEVL